MSDGVLFSLALIGLLAIWWEASISLTAMLGGVRETVQAQSAMGRRENRHSASLSSTAKA